jgi:hypothetical protein
MLGIHSCNDRKARTTRKPERPDSRNDRKARTTGKPELQEWLEGQDRSLRQYIGATMSSSWTSDADRICRVYNLKLYLLLFLRIFCVFGAAQDGTLVLAQISCLCLPKMSTSQHCGNFHSHPLIFTWRTKIIKSIICTWKDIKTCQKIREFIKASLGSHISTRLPVIVPEWRCSIGLFYISIPISTTENCSFS